MNPFSKLGKLAALAVGGIVFTSIACNDMEGDARKANLKVREDVASAAKHRMNPTTRELEKEFNSAVSDLNAANNEKNASSAHKIRAASMLAQAEYEAGDRYVRDLSKIDPQIDAAIWEISQLGRQIQVINGNISGLKSGDPAIALKDIETKRTTAAAASAAAAAKAAELKTAIDKVNQEIEALRTQKDANIAEADATADKASKASLKESVAMLDAVTESRRKAGNLGHAIDKTSAKLLPLQRDMATEEMKKKAADAAVAALDESKKTVDGKWTSVQAEITAQKVLAAGLGEQLAAKAKTLDDLNKNAATLRAKALEQYDKSAKHSAAASAEAKTLAGLIANWSKNFSEAPEASAWKQLGQTYNLNVFRLSQAEALNAQGDVHSMAGNQLTAQQKLVAELSKTLTDAGVTMPASLTPDGDPKKEIDAANKAYSTAFENFDGVYGARDLYPQTYKDAAQVSKMFTLYSQYLNGDSTKLDAAKKIFTEVYGTRKNEPGVLALPADLRG